MSRCLDCGRKDCCGSYMLEEIHRLLERHDQLKLERDEWKKKYLSTREGRLNELRGYE